MQTIHHRLAAFAFAIALLNLAAPLRAEHGCCARCGCTDGCRKICRLVEEEKKVEVTCWGCKCEDFCINGKSCRGCKHCQMVCEGDKPDCDCKTASAVPRKFTWYEWIPGCATVHTKKKLMKRTETVKIPSFKWKVEELCPECESKVVSVEVPAGVEVPPIEQALNEPAAIGAVPLR